MANLPKISHGCSPFLPPKHGENSPFLPASLSLSMGTQKSHLFPSTQKLDSGIFIDQQLGNSIIYTPLDHLHSCVLVHVWVQVHMSCGAHVRSKDHVGPHFVWDRVLPPLGTCICQACWPMDCWGSSYILCLSPRRNAGITDVLMACLAFTQVLESLFTHWAISLVLSSAFSC